MLNLLLGLLCISLFLKTSLLFGTNLFLFFWGGGLDQILYHVHQITGLDFDEYDAF